MTLRPDQQNWPEFAAFYGRFIRAHTALAQPPLVPEISLYLASAITPLWRATEESFARQNIPPPFWSFAWPGGQAMARYILDNPDHVKNKRVFDFASGSGLIALAAKKAGASDVIANDVDPLAIVAMALNADANHLSITSLHQNMVHKALPDVDVIIAGDFCYEWPMAGYAIEWLRALVLEGKTVLFADPGRPHAPKDDIEELAIYDVPTTREVEDREVKETRVFRMLAMSD